jgi:hypothetical protein
MPYTLGPRVEFEPLPTADYKLTLKGWKEITVTVDTQFSKKGDTQIEWSWIVAVPNAEDAERRTWSPIPATFSEKSTFVHIVTALGIVDSVAAIEAGATIDPDAGVGKSCLGTIVKALKSDNKTWGDKITQYAPLANGGAKPKTDMAAKLRERLGALMAFAGDMGDPPADLTQQAIRDSLITIGAKPITARAARYITEQIELANTMGINDFDGSATPTTLKDALVLYEKITARLDA